MNAAARFLSQSTLSRTWMLSLLLSKLQVSLITLFAGIAVSALSMVYVTNTTRDLNAGLEQVLAERNQLHIQWSQLLLEKGTLLMQARIQQVASNKLGMIMPDSKSVVIVNE